MKNIGVKNTYSAYKLVLTVTFVVSIFPVILFWIIFGSDYHYNQFLNGEEVQAIITDKFIVDDYDEDGCWERSHYEYAYKYINPEGKVYQGTTKHANLEIGEKITIVIDPDSLQSTDRPLSYIIAHKNDLHRDFTLACIFSGLFLITSYLFFYRVVYRNALDKKILKFYGSDYIKNGVEEGEVVKTVKWVVVGYVKVRYRDTRDIAKEKWARSWFTLRETNFLEEKKYVKIIVYKNTFGIMEEMQGRGKR